MPLVGSVCSAANVSIDGGTKAFLCWCCKHGLEGRNTVVGIAVLNAMIIVLCIPVSFFNLVTDI